MKKFRTKKNHRKYWPMLLFILFFILFIALSLIKLNKSYSDVVTAFFNKKELSLFKNQINIGSMTQLYLFKYDEKETAEKKDSLILIEGDSSLKNSLKDNLQKLGIKALTDSKQGEETLFTIKLEFNSDDDLVTIKNKDYAKLTFDLPKKMNDKIIKDYLDSNYPNVLQKVNYDNYQEINIKVNNKNNYVSAFNSTEIIALLMYYILGD